MKTVQYNNTIEKPKILSPWMNTEDAADYIGCKSGSLKRWRSEGTGPEFVIVNRKLVRYHITKLDQYIAGDAATNPIITTL